MDLHKGTGITAGDANFRWGLASIGPPSWYVSSTMQNNFLIGMAVSVMGVTLAA